jgi:NitT/TauT family transport system ATP-binding protein
VFAITNRIAPPLHLVPSSVAPDRTARQGSPSSRDGAREGTSLALDSVSVAYGEDARIALSDVTLRVAAGEFVCLLGPSGSGKSTVLNVIAGLVNPASGTVTAGGRAVTAPGPERAVVFQDAALFPWLTLRQNVEFPLGVQRMGARERAERSEYLLRLVHLWKFRDSYPHELSGGMRQRGGIARALATDPAVLLMDEPFAALDAQTREILHNEVERIWSATKKTVVFVTHNVREAVRLADRVVLLGTRPGRILEERVIDLPRPRGLNDESVARVAAEIAGRLAGEVEKIAKEEADDAWSDAERGLRPVSRRAVGAGH